MRKFPPRRTLRNTFMAVTSASLIFCFTIGLTAQSLDKSDWKQWTKSDVHKILSKSPWVSNCCRTWLGGGETIPPDPGFTVVIVSSRTVREALVRNMQLDKRYEKLDAVGRQEADHRMEACLNEQFDSSIVFSFSYLGTGQDASTRRSDKFVVRNLYIATSDGRKIPGHLTPTSVAMTCGAFPHDTELASLWPLWSNLTSPWWPLGPGKEVAFPRFVDGKPTIAREDKTIRVHLKDNNGTEAHPSNSAYVDFSIGKLIYQGKPDF